MNQNEAAEYITRRGIKITSADMSRLARYGAGPEYTKHQGRKNFAKEDLDIWVLQERERRDREVEQELGL